MKKIFLISSLLLSFSISFSQTFYQRNKEIVDSIRIVNDSIISHNTRINAKANAADLTTTSTASKGVLRDANGNVFVNNDIEGFSSVVTAAGTTTLTNASAGHIVMTGSTTQTVVLPNATTLALNWHFDIHNQSTGAITIQTNGGATLWTIAAGVDAEFICTSIGTSAGTWEVQYAAANTATGKSLTVSNTLTLAGTDATVQTFPSTSQNIVGETSTQTLTNKTLTSPVINVGSDAQGDIYYRSSGGTFTRLAPGTSGQYLATGGAAANPSWVTMTALTNTLNVVTLGSAFSSTVVTEATVTGMSFAVTAGKNYMIEVIGTYQTAATTTGGELGFFLTASGVGTIVGNAEGGIVSTAAATSLSQQISAIGAADLANSNLITTGVTAINSPHYIKAKVVFVCTTSGTFNVGWASEVAASAAQLNAGSTLIYQQLN